MKRLFTTLLCAALPSLVGGQCASSCTVTNLVSLGFGTVEPFGNNVDASATFSVGCTAPLLAGCTETYSLLISSSDNGALVPRQMQSSGNLLDYNIYTSALRNTVWGNGAQGTSTVTGSISFPLIFLGGTLSNSHTAFGRAFGGQGAAPGFYSDAPLITLIY